MFGLFATYDKNDDGQLDQAELYELVRLLSWPIRPLSLHALFFEFICFSMCCYMTLQVLAGLSEKKTQGSLILATCKDIAVAVILHSIKLRKRLLHHHLHHY